MMLRFDVIAKKRSEERFANGSRDGQLASEAINRVPRLRKLRRTRFSDSLSLSLSLSLSEIAHEIAGDLALYEETLISSYIVRETPDLRRDCGFREKSREQPPRAIESASFP